MESWKPKLSINVSLIDVMRPVHAEKNAPIVVANFMHQSLFWMLLWIVIAVGSPRGFGTHTVCTCIKSRVNWSFFEGVNFLKHGLGKPALCVCSKSCDQNDHVRNVAWCQILLVVVAITISLSCFRLSYCGFSLILQILQQIPPAAFGRTTTSLDQQQSGVTLSGTTLSAQTISIILFKMSAVVCL